ncbi:MAG: hypothetical protein CMJ46_04215 [Planctomyces sp.]|nr:hypothetical protein [Planctomyces sp.]
MLHRSLKRALAAAVLLCAIGNVFPEFHSVGDGPRVVTHHLLWADDSDDDDDAEEESDKSRKKRWVSEEKSRDGASVIGRIGYNAFQTFGRDDSIGNVELMPYLIEDDTLWFTDFRFFVDNDLGYGGNIGFGYRQEITSKTIFGTNVFYDIDETSEELFHQLGFGLEAYGKKWDARANFYFPIGETAGDTEFRDSNYRYLGTTIVYDLERRTNQAYQGVDAELGFLIPTDFTEDHNVRLFGGGYHFQGDMGEDINGYKVRLQGDVTESLQTQIEYTSDDTFGNNVMLAFYYQFPNGVGRSKRSNPVNMLEGFVHRNYNIVVADAREYESGVAVTTTSSGGLGGQSGVPKQLVVKHVFSDGSTPSGTHAGTIDDPFQTITDAQLSGADIIFVHGGSTLGESVTVAAGQKIYGEGGNYLVENGTMSSFLLPRATSSQELPTLLNSSGNAFTLSNNSEIGGFRVNGASGFGVYANGTTNGTLRDIEIFNSGGGIGLNNVSGDFILDDILVEGASGSAIAITNNQADILLDATIHDTNGYALEIVDYGAGSITFDKLAFSGSGGRGIYLEGIDEDLTFNKLAIADTTEAGLHIKEGSGAIIFKGDTKIQDATDNGIIIEDYDGEVTFDKVDVELSGDGNGVVLADNTETIYFKKLDVTNENGTGLKVENSDDVRIVDGNIETASGSAADIENSTVNIHLTKVSSSDAPQYGVRVVDTDGQFIVYGNDALGTGGSITGADAGIFVSGSGKVAFQFMTLDQNNTGVRVVDSDEFYLAGSVVSNVDEWGVDSLNTKFLDVSSSLLESNGESDHNRIRFLAVQQGAYEFSFRQSTIAANAGSAFEISSLAGAEGSTLGVLLSKSDVIVANSADAGLDIDWNGLSSVTVAQNEIVTGGGDKVALRFNGTSTTKTSALNIQQNVFQLNGANDVAIDIKTAGTSDIAVNQNNVYMNAVSQTGFQFDLAKNADFVVHGNKLGATEPSSTAILFSHVGTGGNGVVSNNQIGMNTSSSLIDRGIIFESIDGVLDLNGSGNIIQGASEIFSIPTDHFDGTIIINNTSVVGDAD